MGLQLRAAADHQGLSKVAACTQCLCGLPWQCLSCPWPPLRRALTPSQYFASGTTYRCSGESTLHTARWLYRTVGPIPVQAAAAAEMQTELAARVSTWRQKIQPMLDEQEAQPAFDIHAYGDCMLEELATVSAVAPDDPVQLQGSQVGLQGWTQDIQVAA